MSSQALKTDAISALDDGIENGLRWMLARQSDEGYWVGRLQTNSSMEAEWTLALHFMGLGDHPLRPKLVNAILREQRHFKTNATGLQSSWASSRTTVNVSVACHRWSWFSFRGRNR